VILSVFEVADVFREEPFSRCEKWPSGKELLFAAELPPSTTLKGFPARFKHSQNPLLAMSSTVGDGLLRGMQSQRE